MRKTFKNGWKRVCSVILAAAMVVTMLPASAQAATTSSDNGDGTFDNPVIYSDVPDIDMIRVNDTYYMVSTTMHLSPGCPIMKSTDLVNWEIVNYVFDTLGDKDAMCLRNGESMYGNGQWASSLQYHDGTYYVAFNSNTTGKAYIYTTDDIERGSWKKTTLNGAFHDMALFFDDNGKAYIVYGNTEIKAVELNEDLTGVNKDTAVTLFNANAEGEKTYDPNNLNDKGSGYILGYEGTHIMKKDGYYYVFNICWPNGKGRTEVCHRTKTFPGTEWENEVILQADFQNNGVGGGVAQGGVIDTVDGKWYGFLFQDHGAIGRVPVLTDCTWKDGWPMLGKDGDGKTVETTMKLPVSGSDVKSIVKSDEFYNDAEHRVFEATEEQTASEEAPQVNGASEEETKTETVELVANGTFEDGTTDGWQAFEGGSIQVTADDGNEVLELKDRNCSSSSAMYDLSGKIEKGTTYTIKGRMKYTTGPETKDFVACFRNHANGVKNPWEYRPVVGKIELQRGEWKDFEFKYTADDFVNDKGVTYPFGTDRNIFFIEDSGYCPRGTEQNPLKEEQKTNFLMNYYLDDISISYQKAVEAGGEEPGGEEPGGEEPGGGDTPVVDDSLVEVITNGNVESGNTDGWTTTPGETNPPTLEVVQEEGNTGNYCLKVSGRKAMGAGACQNISGKVAMNKEYTISGKLKYTTGPDTKTFYVTIQHGKDYTYRQNIVTINAKKGEWVEFSKTYTPRDQSEALPFDVNDCNVFVETPWAQSINAENDLMDYYLDDFSMTTPSDQMISDGSFEKGLGPWQSFGKTETVERVEGENAGCGDNTCLKVSGRTAEWQGPSVNFDNKLTPGNIYTITAYVKYDAETPAETTFNITMKGGQGDATKYQSMASATVKSREWTKITGEWIMPEDASNLQEMYINTAKDAKNIDFYVDNVSMTETVPAVKDVADIGENDYNGSNLDLVWQWNHNPNNNNWSLTDRNGWLRLKTGNKVTSILNARNTLTQRTYGPTCSGKIKMDISNMKAGDVAGLASFSYNYGYIAVKKEGNGAKLVMVDASGNSKAEKDAPVVKESVDCTGTTVYLKEDFNFAGNADGNDKDTVSFYYSFDGSTWTKLGTPMKMSYELNHFMGSRFAIFNYATRTPGGYVDVDYFRVSDKITGASASPAAEQKASMTATPELTGVVNSEAEVKLMLDELTAGNHSSLKASISIPGNMSVEDVVFNTAAIKGEADYTYKNHRLILAVKGDDVSFKAEDKLFATIKLKMDGYVSENKTVNVEADYISVDNGAADYDVTKAKASIVQKYLDTKALGKKLGYGNPIMSQEFGADPYAIVYNGRVYVYMTADDYEYDENGKLKDNSFSYIKTLRVVSSSDMVNWTDHGEIPVAGKDGVAKWASNSWAPAIAYNKVNGEDKFFLYFANGGGGIGVIEGDSPIGPWRDPVGHALLDHKSPGCEGVPWMFDPAVLVDDNGSAYIYFGGGVPNDGKNGEQLNPKSARVAKLGADMVSIDGLPQEIDAPCMFEDSGIFKFGDKYYYSYCSNFIGPHGDGYPGFGTICYMVSDNPMGPFTYAGEVFENPQVWFGVGGNNHHATFVFEGQSYFIYHAQTVSVEEGKAKGYRSTHIDKIELDKDGNIKPIKGTYKGIPQLRGMNPYERIDAETIAWNAGVKARECKEPANLFKGYNMALTNLQDGDWTSVSQLEFGKNGAETFEASVASAKGGKIEVRLDSPEGTQIGTMDVPATGSEETYKKVSCKVDNVTGTKNVFLVFRGTASADETIMNVDYYQFTEKAVDNKQLNDKVAEAEKLLADLSEAEKAKLQAVIDEVKALIGKEGVTQEEIDQALSKLSQAVKEAEKTVEPEKPDPVKPDPNAELKKYVGKTFTSSNLKYKITACSTKTKNVTVIGTAKKLTSVTVRDTVKYKNMTFKVTAIGNNAFAKQTTMKSAVIGKYVTSIGSKAFYNDKKLTKVTFKGTAVKTIGKDAFKGISKKAAFSMKKTFTAKNLKYKITKSSASAKEVTVTGASKKLTSVNVPATVKYNGMTFKVTAINKKAFKNQKKLTSVTVGKNVKTIGSEAFSGAKKLGKIKFSGTAIKTIGKNAFKNIKKNAVFSVKKSKKAYYTKLLKKAGTKNFKVK